MQRSDDSPAIEAVLQPQSRDLGGFTVGRVLPAIGRRLLGPFIFFDQMGPGELLAGHGLDVRPHPHINLATVTYLFAGEILHRDSLGSAQVIRPGDVNWMTAGRGIVHSERTPPATRDHDQRLHGIQLWVALPRAHEETEPAFFHHPAASLPEAREDGAILRVLAGGAYGLRSPVRTFSPLFYVDATLAAGGQAPVPDEPGERALYLVDGVIEIDGRAVSGPQLLIFAPGAALRVRAQTPARLIMLGGEPLDGPRHIWWNFVSSRPERIEEAKAAWAEARFPTVPGDEAERIPLPER
jgi:redox-sensitive bicupin YhaK (pirin superfamily)